MAPDERSAASDMMRTAHMKETGGRRRLLWLAALLLILSGIAALRPH